MKCVKIKQCCTSYFSLSGHDRKGKGNLRGKRIILSGVKMVGWVVPLAPLTIIMAIAYGISSCVLRDRLKKEKANTGRAIKVKKLASPVLDSTKTQPSRDSLESDASAKASSQKETDFTFNKLSGDNTSFPASTNPAANSSKPLLDLNEFITKCSPNQQAMIYGFKSCDYIGIKSWLESEKNEKRFRDIFDYFLGYSHILHGTSEGRKIKKINYQSIGILGSGSFKTSCKAALANIVIENFQRSKSGLPIIPVIFILEKDDEKLDITKILAKKLVDSKKAISMESITDAEIRRGFKLCFDPGLDEGIRSIAQKTFIFIALATNKKTELVKYKFSIRSAPWDSAEWQNGWERRKKSTPKQNKISWREQVRTLAALNN